jgi:hypothetical protein
MINKVYAPLLLILFNRFSYTKKLIKKVNHNKFKKIYIVIDGPRYQNKFDKIEIRKIRLMLLKTKWNSKIQVLIRKNNHGCAINIYKSIKWFFSNEKMGIILEDDCIPNKYFFEYVDFYLKKFSNSKNIGAISGIDRRLINKSHFKDNYLSKFFGAWGWATWRKEIKHFRIKINHNSKIEKNIKNWVGNSKVTKNIIFNAKNGLNKFNTWDYQMTYMLLKRKKYIIRPTINQIDNIGRKKTTHTNFFLPNRFKNSKYRFNKLHFTNYNFFDDLFFYFTQYIFINRIVKIFFILKKIFFKNLS